MASRLDPAFLKSLRTLPPAASLLTAPEDTRPFESDGLSAYRATPDVVALPESEAQVAAILQLCHQHQVPVVARGAGTGLSAARCRWRGRCCWCWRSSTGSWTSTRWPASRDGAAGRAQPGHFRGRRALRPLLRARPFRRRSPATIGGNVAENSGGVHCLKYGLTVHNILKLQRLTIDGELLEIGGEALDAAGYDLLALMTGSEGMLGIITEVTVKLLPQARTRAGGAGGVRRRDKSGRRGRRHHRRRHYSRRAGDDGQAGDPGRRRLCPRRLSARCRGDPAVRTRRHQRGGLGRHRRRCARC